MFSKKIGTKEIAVSSMLGALVFIMEYLPLDVRFPIYPRVTWDPYGIPIIISLLFFGHISAIYTCLVGCSVIFLRSISGGFFKVIAELSTLLGYALIGKSMMVKTVSAISFRVIVMTITNYFMLPFFYNMPESVVIGILPVLALFNISQALINIIPAQVIYQRLRNFAQ